MYNNNNYDNNYYYYFWERIVSHMDQDDFVTM